MEAILDPIRIWYQSFVDEEHGKVYWERLRHTSRQSSIPARPSTSEG